MVDEVLKIESLDLEARGIARRDGKVVFVEGALPGERVYAATVRRKPSYEIARVETVLTPSSQRVEPRCPHFGVCGGCAMQHLEPTSQVAIKQRALEDTFWHVGKIRPQRVLPPLHGPTWGYRYRARLSVRVVPKKGGVLVGFHERKSSYVADMRECHVLPRHVSDLLLPLRAMIAALSRPERIPQIEVALGEGVTALVLRHIEPLNDHDITVLRDFAARHNVQWWLQSKGPDTVHPLDPAHGDTLAYTMPEFGLRMPYRPTDFTQVNHAINRSMVSRALKLLEVQPTDRVADLFCGLGNFTLPLATQGREAVGVEGSKALTDRALEAAARHGLEGRTRFATLNLFEVDVSWLRGLGYFDRMLIDPPREGAHAVAQALSQLTPAERPRRIVYVSCNPATLARDAAIMVHEGGYVLKAAGVINMFPHTGHVESIAVFESLADDEVLHVQQQARLKAELAAQEAAEATVQAGAASEQPA
ncbi:23S rRNA (uracil(1939)-C(5))-methyltransferase RlmD [Bordetella avium]|uniref:23S rRNA (uracil(1939)-C(5))-methyltransferase RlmD n=1 Tax=Bordetella avium (strain 197N) TaxID=360910 RepID=RLMD_BORA1|nr:23S rRNA (uracil(1939)-C(5))-methyltransferase RlmD [Bordetella avium]Q2L016.1 RecName: Full=23S rRNA (uracil(1939)-C(5))-methyltransferase RlmD; AltName: Full=23S rRNA(m5U1939)-methyltransferase [Bordetella avium 197N]AZY49308.1 23S rRNA (uracil(1939)-C(5))-methyltransferase RlmD [Bordetella avium]RIQ52743.1 23S rRNA (uracil(1939)-C(5))-methyltransferase RlmD [Bordetella avium]RIQ71470.1 23S rRNA (uracil(1939)-C(5))-methyltransferase RlmD [Bordetella avium]CAJ49585.1 23s rRNA (uracil-5-)-m